MAKSNNDVLLSEDKFDMTSMIDVVFLLLIYFMYLPIQQEADLLFSLPANTAPSANAVIEVPTAIAAATKRAKAFFIENNFLSNYFFGATDTT